MGGKMLEKRKPKWKIPQNLAKGRWCLLPFIDLFIILCIYAALISGAKSNQARGKIKHYQQDYSEHTENRVASNIPIEGSEILNYF